MNGMANQRVVTLVDMDCFYCQVEERLNPDLKGKPVAVVQYNQSWKGGGIIAVNYIARARGVTRFMRGTEAREVCPDINLVPVPTVRGKADLTNYRNAGDEVASVFSEFSDCVQRASIDEAYIDLTKAVKEAIENQTSDLNISDFPNTFVVGYCNLENKSESDREKGLHQWLRKVESEKTRDSADYQLSIGAIIVEKMRMEIFKRTGFHCSAGIAHNKILAKLTAGLHKPNKQTLLPQDSVPELYETVPIKKVKNLGGKLGDHVAEQLSINYMSELYKFSLGQLNQKFDEKTSYWLHNIARGIDLDPVTPRLTPESIGCCKNFRGKASLKTKSDVEHWMGELASEISERLYKDLEKHNRRARQLVVSFSQKHSTSKCGPLFSYQVSKIVRDAMGMIKKFNCASENEDVWSPPITYLGLSACKFTEEVSSSIEKYLKANKPSGNSDQRPDDSPCCSKTSTNEHSHNRINSDKTERDENENFQRTNGVNHPVENIKKSIDGPVLKPKDSKASFFLEFLSTKKESCSSTEAESNSEREEGDEKEGNDAETDPCTSKEARHDEERQQEEEEEEPETWISLSELFPNVNQAEPAVVESLPAPLQKKFREKLNSVTGDQDTEIQKENMQILSETCRECGKNIPPGELPIHLDYHAALKLYSEINKPTNTTTKAITGRISDTKESLTKRKKKGGNVPSKKMKSLKSFFAPIVKK